MPPAGSRHVARKRSSKARNKSSRKLPFDIPKMMRLVRNAVRDFPKAVLFELADRGYSSPFEILIACILTIRTLEEVSLPAALKLFGSARTPEEMARRDESLGICGCFHAGEIHDSASRETAAPLLAGDQQADGAVWEAHLHGETAALLDLSGAGLLSAGGSHRASLTDGDRRQIVLKMLLIGWIRNAGRCFARFGDVLLCRIDVAGNGICPR